MMASAVLAQPTRALQGTNRGSGPAMEESENDVGILEQLLLYADKHYLAGKLPLGDHLGKVLHGVEEYHNVGPFRFHASQLKWTGYHRLWPPRPLHQLCGQCDVKQCGGEFNRSPGRLHTRTRLSSVPKTNRDSSLNTTFCQSVTFHIDLAWHHCKRSCQCSGVKGSARKGRLDLRFASARCLEIVCGAIATPTSARIVERVTVGSTSDCRTILSPRGLPGRSRPCFPRVGTFSCPLLPTIYNGTLRTIHLASNTARRTTCSFHPDDHVSLKLA
ncbi:uncharacterized protein TNCV_1897231 [Trichonephila clavipes]|nr:uncharacterized protein TNCV_1897231 [Trichonephila clavipes]